MSTANADPGSFRDPTSRVLLADGRVLRGIRDTAADDIGALLDAPFFEAALAAGQIVPTASIDPAGLPGEWTAAVEHERLDVITYPYEWSFSMLRDAARLQLDLTRAALADGMITKDATPYNVQFVGSRPVFIDVGSFERLRPGEPWFGYRQFCQLFLNPLLLQARAGLDLQPLLRGSLEGITPSTTASLLGRRDRWRRSTFTHVTMHARAERRYEAETRDVRGELRAAGFGPKIIAAQATNLDRAVRGLHWGASRSEWSEYSERGHYADADLAGKEQFVEATVEARRPAQVLDLGANDGHFSRLAARHAERVVAVDSDHLVIDRLYASLRDESNETITPLVIDLADPSPARGWRGRERSAFATRVRSDLVLCLAVVHHLALTNTVPFDEIVAFLSDLGDDLVVEFPHRDDPMVQRLLSRKRDGLFDHYAIDRWEPALEAVFAIDERLELPSGTRTLYRCRRR